MLNEIWGGPEHDRPKEGSLELNREPKLKPAFSRSFRLNARGWCVNGVRRLSRLAIAGSHASSPAWLKP